MDTLAHLLSPLLRRPLLLLTLLWMGGIVTAAHVALPWGSWVAAALLFLLAWMVTRTTPPIARITLSGAVFCLAAAMSTWQSLPPSPHGLHYLPPGGMILRGYPLAPPTETPTGWHVVFHVIDRREGAVWQPVDSDIYLAGHDTPPALGYQQQIMGKQLPPSESDNTFGFSWAAYLHEQGLAAAVLAYTITPLPDRAPSSRLLTLRSRLERCVIATMPGVYHTITAQCLVSILFGIHGETLPPQIVDQFRRAGTIHLMVVSGSQVAMLAGVLLFPLWFLGEGQARTSYPRLRIALMLLSLPLLLLYVMLADRGPTVDRALVMTFLGMLSLFLAFSPLARRRSFRPDGLTLLAAATLILLVSRPVLLFSPAMQLSYLAVFGLIVATPVLMRLFRHFLGALSVIPAATLAAQVMTVPVLAWHFGTISLVGPLTNLLAIPLVTLLVPFGLLATLCAGSVPAIAMAINLLNAPLIKLLLWLNAQAAHLPWAQCTWPLRSGWAVLLYYLTGGLILMALSRWADKLERDWQVPAGREPRMW